MLEQQKKKRFALFLTKCDSEFVKKVNGGYFNIFVSTCGEDGYAAALDMTARELQTIAKQAIEFGDLVYNLWTSTVKWFSSDLEKSDDTTIQSKADQLLGCGKDQLSFVMLLCMDSRLCRQRCQKIPPWRFEISESVVRDLSRDIVVAWNHGVHSLNSLSKGGDWIKFFKLQFYSTYFSDAH
ncbi:unnamed protein product [Brassica napus]|uniref:(rape) hypothetical protein n=1 Tax=Brassica napus TaxID=3708 RepID=A0A816I851_BRANA|nr:unnamed protein product [Brassica napus]